MTLGLFELFLLFLIISILFGPKLYPKIKQYQQRHLARNKRLQKVAAQRKAEELARRQIRNAKIKIAAVSALCVTLVFGAIYFAVWPTAVQVNAYRKAQADAIVAELYSAATAVEGYETISLEGYQNITQVQFYDDWLYLAAEGGKIIRVRENGTGLTELVSTGGEILSFAFDGEGNIIFTDAAYDAAGGALLMASFDGFAVTVTPLFSALSYPTGVTVAEDGMVYFLNATAVSAMQQGGALQALRTAQIAHTQDGVLYAYDPADASYEIMATGICFGAGLALSATQDELYLSQLTDASLWAVAVTARDTSLGGADTTCLCEGLSGYPAGLSVAEDGTLWGAMLSPELAWFESLCEQPALREVLLRLPQGTRDVLLSYQGAGLVFALSADGDWADAYVVEGKQGATLLADVCAVGNRVYFVQGNGNSIGYFTL